MAAEIREAIVDADALALEDVAPDPGQHLLDRVARADVDRGLRGGRDLERGERAAIDLAVAGERQRRERHERRRDHVLGGAAARSRAERGEIDRARRGHEVGDEALVARGLFLGEDDDLRHGGMGLNRGLDLAELDAESPDFT